ncbi:hypothetical protein Lalb_Chr01g0011361 [Lupinus albus]|uniref:Uncharacterized protein n=1 Tax=Lupinus albus TaxID=3870 RepID=A0A6A4R583_LUPAL|nr:hypothetical protein Lalb_Chr01g0011361 [Lupinus albus]
MKMCDDLEKGGINSIIKMCNDSYLQHAKIEKHTTHTHIISIRIHIHTIQYIYKKRAFRIEA